MGNAAGRCGSVRLTSPSCVSAGREGRAGEVGSGGRGQTGAGREPEPVHQAEGGRGDGGVRAVVEEPARTEGVGKNRDGREAGNRKRAGGRGQRQAAGGSGGKRLRAHSPRPTSCQPSPARPACACAVVIHGSTSEAAEYQSDVSDAVSVAPRVCTPEEGLAPVRPVLARALVCKGSNVRTCQCSRGCVLARALVEWHRCIRQRQHQHQRPLGPRAVPRPAASLAVRNPAPAAVTRDPLCDALMPRG